MERGGLRINWKVKMIALYLLPPPAVVTDIVPLASFLKEVAPQRRKIAEGA
jgi:hypothetical protein